MARPSRKSTFAVVLSFALLSACQLINNRSAEREAEEAEDRAGRIAMILGDEVIEANPELASQTISLPPAVTLTSWAQAGAKPSKVVGHVAAGADFTVDWRQDAGRGSDRRSALTSPPIASEESIFVLDSGQTIRAFDLETGAGRWSTKVPSGNNRDRIGIGGGIAYDSGRVFVSSGFSLILALDAATGDQIWRREMDAPMTGSPTIRDGRMFVTSNNNEVFAINLDDGQVVWSDQAIAEPARVLGSPSPAAIEDIVVTPYSSGEVIAYLATNGRRLWTDALSRPGRFTPISAINDIAARPVLASGLVIVANQSGITAAIDGRTGTRVWVQPIGSTQAPALAGTHLFIAGVDGRLAAIDAASGGVYWAKDLPKFKNTNKQRGRISYSGPLIASGHIVLVSSEGEVLRFDPQTGEEVGRLDIKQKVFLEPIAVGERIYILTDNARLVAIR
ncbi:MAG: PQQ-binding-like beta-propeller repeat protein [Pseudomonadota bacterium]